MVYTEASSASGRAGSASAAGTEAKEAVTVLSRAKGLFKVLAGLGFVVTAVTGIVEAVEGAKQCVHLAHRTSELSDIENDSRKDRLIEAIQQCQVARLEVAFFQREAMYILQQLTNMTMYMNFLPGGSAPNPIVATEVSVAYARLTAWLNQVFLARSADRVDACQTECGP